MEKSEMMKKFEAETGKEAIDYLTEYPFDDYTRWLEAKAAAYDRLMSGGKKTLKEWANILGKPVAVDIEGRLCFAHVPVMYPDDDECMWANSPKYYGEEIYLLPTNLIDFDGDWKDSLTLPDGW
jgi:hypothetical protein